MTVAVDEKEVFMGFDDARDHDEAPALWIPQIWTDGALHYRNIIELFSGLN